MRIAQALYNTLVPIQLAHLFTTNFTALCILLPDYIIKNQLT